MAQVRLNLKTSYCAVPSGGTFTTGAYTAGGGETPTAGEKIIALVVYANTMTVATPSGWTVEASGALDASRNYVIYSHTASAGESPPTWTYTGTAGETVVAIGGWQNVIGFRIGSLTITTSAPASAASMTPIANEHDLYVVVAGAVTGFNFWQGLPGGGPPNVLSENADNDNVLTMRTYSGLSSEGYPLTPGTPTPTYTMTTTGGTTTSSIAFQVLLSVGVAPPLRIGQRDDDLHRSPRLRNKATSRQRTPRVGRNSYW